MRRDLFDARFQLIAEGAGDAPEDPRKPDDGNLEEGTQPYNDRKALAFLDAPSDLVPGVYEGGLKTWECSLDLVDYLDGLKVNGKNHSFVGKNILDVRFLCFQRMYGNLTFSQDWLWYWRPIDVCASRITRKLGSKRKMRDQNRNSSPGLQQFGLATYDAS